MRLFRHVTEHAAVPNHVFMNVFAFKQHVAIVGAKHACDHLHCGRLSSAVRPEKTNNFAGLQTEAHIADGGNASKTPKQVLHFQHCQPSSTLCSIQHNRNFSIVK